MNSLAIDSEKPSTTNFDNNDTINTQSSGDFVINIDSRATTAVMTSPIGITPRPQAPPHSTKSLQIQKRFCV